MPKIAVVILNWNGIHLLKEFLPKVVETTLRKRSNNRIDFEPVVVVADNGSTDNSINYVNENYPEIEIVALSQNFGFTGGYNRALKNVEADYYVLLNSDVAPSDNWLEALVYDFETNPDVAVCVPKIRSYRDPEKFEYAGAAGGHLDKFGYPFCEGRIFNVIEDDLGQYNITKDVFWASGAALAIRANLYHQVGGLDEDFFAHMEEIDLCWRLKNRGWRVRYIAESCVFHLGGATLDYKNPRKVYLNFRNNLFLLTKNMPKDMLFGRLFQRMLLDGVAGIKFLLSCEFKNFISVLHAHFSFYTKFNFFMNKRKENLKLTTEVRHTEVYRKSIVFQFFIKSKKKYTQLQ